MTEDRIEEFRGQYGPRLQEYLKAKKIETDGTVTVCPRCGEMAGIRKDGSWICVSCRSQGDLLDYVMQGHPNLRMTSATYHIRRALGERITELDAINGNELMEMSFPSAGWLIDDLLGKGLYILAGAPKIGKSWLVLWLADRISKGEPVWGMHTAQCECLYMSLEDTESRIQRRLSEVTGGEAERVWIATEAELLGSGLEQQLHSFIAAHPKTGLIIVDTLQRVRQFSTAKYSYAADYDVITALKGVADRFGITVLVVHHTRKEDAEDPFHLISGTNGLMGSADGALLLRRDDRLSGEAALHITGRDTPDRTLVLAFDSINKQWSFVKEETAQRQENHAYGLFTAIRALAETDGGWQGTATELAAALSGFLPPDIKPHALSRRLNASSQVLAQQYGVLLRTHRTMDTRLIFLSSVPYDAMTQNGTPDEAS